MGMVGGGEGAFIGAIHRMAARLDGEVELVCGAFSREPAGSQRMGKQLNLPPQRVYDDYTDMMTAEAALPAEQRMQFVAIVTPNDTHYPIACAALDAGFHVLSEKPATHNFIEAIELRDRVNRSGLLYGLAHTYAGYPLVKEARNRIAADELGNIRRVMVEYPQGWLSQPEESTGNKQAQWRLDPARGGASACMGDIGVHAAHLAEYVSGLRISQLCADIGSLVEGREMDDDGSILLRFNNGARGTLIASQVCAGEENNLRIRIYGDRGGLDWSQQEPNTLVLKWPDRPAEILRTGGSYLGDAARANTRTPMGHPEGYIEAFANLYRAFAARIAAWESAAGAAVPPAPVGLDCPGIEDAVRGMQFIELVVSASASETKWHDFPKLDKQEPS
jgi:predicted dehydrogenase